jgi:hypothetical protein
MAGQGDRRKGKKPVEESFSGSRTRSYATQRDEGQTGVTSDMGEILHTFKEWAQVMQDQIRFQGEAQVRLQDQLLKMMSPGEESSRSQGIKLIERFKRLNPPSFKGESKPEIAERWIREMEKIFQVVNCAEEDKVNLSTFMLQNQADEWWQTARRRKFEGKKNIKWEDFLEAFREKFFSDFMQDKLEMEFLQLQQGKMTVAQYEAKFSELMKYAPHFIDDEKRATKKFVQGLRAPIRDRVSLFDHAIMSAAFKTASIAEDNLETLMKKCNPMQREKEQVSRSIKIQKKKRKNNSIALEASQVVRKSNSGKEKPKNFTLDQHHKSKCEFCGRPHQNPFRSRGKECYRCGSLTHRIKECPSKPRKRKSGG